MSKRSRTWRDGDDDWATSATSTIAASAAIIDPSPSPTLPEFDRHDFRRHERIDNPYFPLLRGVVYSYGVVDEEGPTGERNDVFATFENKKILGVETHVVRDTAYDEGRLIEDTLDFYAQDKHGNVWYL